MEKATGEMIGDCGPMVQPVLGEDHVELGWHIRRDRQGQGFATEAGAACRDEAWRSARAAAARSSIIRPENVPSWSVARKLGFLRGVRRSASAWATSIWSMEPPG